MGDDRQDIVGKWSVAFRKWKWEYAFSADGKVTWRDPLNDENGTGRWSKAGRFIHIAWYDSTTKESWTCPIKPVGQSGWIDATYGVGAFGAKKLFDLPPAASADLPVNPEISNIPWNRYVDQFAKCKYDMNYKIPSDKSFAYSSILQLEYDDGVAIELDFASELGDRSLSSQEVRDALARGSLGRGGRIFPLTMAPATVPRLWAARSEALAIQNEDVKVFAGVAMAGVAFILTVPAMPAGAPMTASTKVTRQRVPGVGGPGGGGAASGGGPGTQRIPLDKLESPKTSIAADARYQRAAEGVRSGQAPPIEVEPTGRGTYRIQDGVRRSVGAREANMPDIEGKVNKPTAGAPRTIPLRDVKLER